MESKFNVVELPMDIIVNILSLSPAKTLLRFRCVSKTWYNLIHDPEFISMHRIVHKNDKIVLFYNPKIGLDNRVDFFRWKKSDGNEPLSELRDMNWLPVESYCYACFHGSSDGLVCLSWQTGTEVFIWNPSINKFRTIRPDPHIGCVCVRLYVLRVFGFGKNVANGDYNVLSVTYYMTDDLVSSLDLGVVHIYSMSSNSWRKSDAIFDTVICSDRTILSVSIPSVSISGRLYWLCTRTYDSKDHVIVSFDLHSEVIRKIELPKCDDIELERKVGLGSFEESIMLISTSFMNVYAWVLGDHDDVQSWSELFVIRQTDPYIKEIYPGGSHFIVDMSSGHRLVLFDYELLQWRKFEENKKNLYSVFRLIEYTESLVLLDETTSGDGCLSPRAGDMKCSCGYGV